MKPDDASHPASLASPVARVLGLALTILSFMMAVITGLAIWGIFDGWIFGDPNGEGFAGIMFFLSLCATAIGLGSGSAAVALLARSRPTVLRWLAWPGLAVHSVVGVVLGAILVLIVIGSYLWG
jgi:hypothetical protein